mmetsp:Transcript_28283/g.40504  ORF Transcript_28283/g.40504 Transcript_28283/m.40504 type:complete len:159 (-) Transcript_28283:50-526(-)
MALKRKRYSNVDKLAIAQKALLPGSTVTSVARAEGLAESSVRGWVKNIQKLEASVVEISSRKLKAMHYDKIPTLTKNLKAFYTFARLQSPPLPVNLESISIKAKDLSAHLLTEHQNKEQVLTTQEAEALKNMVFSKSWASNWLNKNNYELNRLQGEAD